MFEDILARTDIPKRTDLGDIPRYNAPENKTQPIWRASVGIVTDAVSISKRNTLK